MKVKSLLFVCALLFGSGGANATIVDGVRQRPEPQKLGLAFGQAMYLYNCGVKKFFAGGNEWNTRSSYSSTPYKVTVTKHLEADSWDGKTVLLRDSMASQSRWDIIDLCPDGASYIDYSTVGTANDTLFTITPMGDDVFRLSVGAGNPNYTPESYPGVFFGAKKDETDTRLYWNLTPEDGFVDWYFVSIDGFEAYSTDITIYTEAQKLYEQLQKAKAYGLDVAAQQAVYENENSTTDELRAATDLVKAAISKHDEDNVTADKPVDKTGSIVNPSYDSNNNNGWSGNNPNFQTYTDAEFYNTGYNYYQSINNLPKGVYAVSVQAFYRAGSHSQSYKNWKRNTEHNAKLYALVGQDTIMTGIVNPIAEALTEKLGVGGSGDEKEVKTDDGGKIYIPNGMLAGEAYFNKGMYNNKLFFAVTDGSTTIGLLKTRTLKNDWTLFDNWGLTYYGNGSDAYTLWMKDIVAQTPTFNFGSDTYMTASLVTDYEAKKAQYTQASSAEEVMAAYKALYDSVDSINTNVSLWKEYNTALNTAKSKVINDET